MAGFAVCLCILKCFVDNSNTTRKQFSLSSPHSASCPPGGTVDSDEEAACLCRLSLVVVCHSSGMRL